MRQLDQHNAADYLRESGFVSAGEQLHIRPLAGGVSNVVLYVERSGGEPFVLKQAREQLAVADPWFCSVERIWREVQVLRECQRLLAGSESPKVRGSEGEKVRQVAGSEAQPKALTEAPEDSATVSADLTGITPRLLFEDRDNFAFAMTAAPPQHVVWKSELLAGHARPEAAQACGRLLGRLHAGSWQDARLADELGDRRFFVDLRVDPYYRHVARVRPEFAPHMQALIDSLDAHRCCLVHGDFSPKNLLLWDGRMMLIDFEVGHFGDPAFDLGFFLAHLVLKACRAAPGFVPYLDMAGTFWKEYRAALADRVDEPERDDLERRAIAHFAGCGLSRLDGKSQVDYLNDPPRRAAARQICQQCLDTSPARWEDVTSVAGKKLSEIGASPS